MDYRYLNGGVPLAAFQAQQTPSFPQGLLGGHTQPMPSFPLGPQVPQVQQAYYPIDSLMPLAGGPPKVKTEFDEAVEKDLNSDPAKKTVWHIYNEKSSKEDEHFFKGINEAMDVLLIFAGLFSATAAAFLQFTLPLLQDDSQNETNQLLVSIFYKLENSSYPLPPKSDFQTPANAITANCLILASIAGSLMAAFFAILTKQWVRSIQVGLDMIANQSSRARTRQFRLDGVQDWHFADMAAILPVFLHVSLGLFGAGVVNFLWIIGEKSLSGIITGILVVGSIAYLILSVAPLRSPRAPFWSPLTTILDIVRASGTSAYHRSKSFILRTRPKVDPDDDQKYGANSPVSRLVAKDRSIGVEVVISLIKSADKDTETSILYAALRELQELALNHGIDPNLFNQSMIFSTWSYLAKTCLYNSRPPTLVAGKEDRARFLCQFLEWLGTLTKDPSLGLNFATIIGEGKQLSHAVFNQGFKNRDLRDMVIGHLGRTTINHLEQTNPHECRLCIDSESGRSAAIEQYLKETDPLIWPTTKANGESLTRKQTEGKWVIAYITAQTRCLCHFSPRVTPPKESRDRVRQLIEKFGLGDPKIYDEWRVRRWQAPIMREDAVYNHVSLWVEVIRKAREKSRALIRSSPDKAGAAGDAFEGYNYQHPNPYRDISPPRTWSPSSSRSSVPKLTPIRSRSPSIASPSSSLREKPPPETPPAVIVDASRPHRSRSRSPNRRSPSPMVTDRKRGRRSRSPTSPIGIRSPSRSPRQAMKTLHPTKHARFRSSPDLVAGTPLRPSHQRSQMVAYEGEVPNLSVTTPRITPYRPNFDQSTPSAYTRSRLRFTQDHYQTNIPYFKYVARFRGYLVSPNAHQAEVVLSPAPALELQSISDVWTEISYHRFKCVVNTLHGEDLAEAVPSFRYALRTKQLLPSISSDNSVMLPVDQFIPHISSMLDRLGIDLQVRREFVNTNTPVFMEHKWIMYRFMSNKEFISFDDIAVSLPRCHLRRYLLLIKGVPGQQVQGNQIDPQSFIDELRNRRDGGAGNEMIEIGIMDCSSKPSNGEDYPEGNYSGIDLPPPGAPVPSHLVQATGPAGFGNRPNHIRVPSYQTVLREMVEVHTPDSGSGRDDKVPVSLRRPNSRMQVRNFPPTIISFDLNSEHRQPAPLRFGRFVYDRDVTHEEWEVFTKQLLDAWIERDPGFNRYHLAVRRINVILSAWNYAFFNPRGMDIVLFKGNERCSGGRHGQPEPNLEFLEEASPVSDAEDESSDEEDDDSENSAYYLQQQDPNYRARIERQKATIKAYRREEKRRESAARPLEAPHALVVYEVPMPGKSYR